MSILKKIKNPDKKYRPVPFWSWNEKLDCDKTKAQIEMMNDAGMGGFFMHARGGLETEYLGEEWFLNVSDAIDKAKSFSMYPWVYDENGWPSGFGNGAVNGLGEEYQQKYLRMEAGEKNTVHTISNFDGVHFYYDVNPFYVDTLDAKVTKAFLNTVHEKYYERFGSEFCGFFTDEPEAANQEIPWSLTLPEEYKKEYGEDLIPKLIQLFKPVDRYKDTRMKFWRLVTKLFSNNYMKQIYDWCKEHDLKLTGHLSGEVTMQSQLPTCGACMPHYEYFHIPGIDWLGRNLNSSLILHQVASTAKQTGKDQILSETFGLCGHNVSFSELRRIYEWQMVRGVNLLCQHLEGYSLRGIRKRDYPPALFYQQPWWKAYRYFNDAMSKMGMLISEGESVCKTLLIHPQTTAWICYDNNKNEGLTDYYKQLVYTMEILEQKHVEFHLGDELLMERHGRVENDKLIIGNVEYETVIIPPHIDFFENTKKLLSEFENNGGKIISAEKILGNNIVDNPYITYCFRAFDDINIHYFVNSTEDFQKAKFNLSANKLDIMTGEEQGFSGEYRFTPFDSLVLVEHKSREVMNFQEKALENLDMSGEWKIKKSTENAITLDFCDCYFDGELVEKNIPVTSIQEKALKLRRKVNVRCVYKAEFNFIPDDVCLVCETPEMLSFRINGKNVAFCDEGYFCDESFRKTNIAEYIKPGVNEIEVMCDFVQSEKVYDEAENAPKCQSVRNKLTYNMEIEAIYLTGSFSVATNSKFKALDKNAFRYGGDFTVEKPVTSIMLKNIEQQGFPFFAGNISVCRNIITDNINKKLIFNMKGINAVDIKINGSLVSTVLWNYSEVDLSDYLNIGENEIELTLYNNLRNLLGPHHLEEGECLNVRPCSFFKGESLWVPGWMKPLPWNDQYCFVETSLEFEQDN